jgi:hypothetical protein
MRPIGRASLGARQFQSQQAARDARRRPMRITQRWASLLAYLHPMMSSVLMVPV